MGTNTAFPRGHKALFPRKNNSHKEMELYTAWELDALINAQSSGFPIEAAKIFGAE